MPAKTKSIAALDSHVGFWLRFVSNQVSHAFSLKTQARGVTVAEWVVMRELYDGELRPTDLAERMGMTRGAISKLADRLLDKKLIARAAVEGDQRAQILSLTAAGRALTPKLAESADMNDEEFFGHLSPSNREAIKAVMKEIVRRRELRAVPLD
jgi:DNA-binding MarR family transcriptional regulator